MVKVYNVQHVTESGKTLKYEVSINKYGTGVEIVYDHSNRKQLIAKFSDCKNSRQAFSLAMERVFIHAETM